MVALLFVMATLFLSVLAARSFMSRQFPFVDIETVPGVLMGRTEFNAGISLYCLLLVTFYLVIMYYWGPLHDVLLLYKDNELVKSVLPFTSTSSAQHDPLLPWLAAVVATLVFTWDNKYNPFRIILDGIFDVMQVPRRAVTVYEALRVTKFGRLDDVQAKQVAADPLIIECLPEYFRADRRSMEYRWAHVCYLHLSLVQSMQIAARVFSERSLKWQQVDRDYQELAGQVRLWLGGPKDYRDAYDIMQKIAQLKDAHYRLLACVSVITSRDQRDLWSRIDRISMVSVRPKGGDLGAYIVALVLGLFFSVLIGRELSTFVYRRFVDASPATGLEQFDLASFRFWMSIVLIIYTVPIVAMFQFRRLNLGRFPLERRRYWGLYAAWFAVAYVLAVAAIPALAGHPFNPGRLDYWRKALGMEWIWGMVPGFLTAFVTYRLDSPAGCREARRRVLLDRAKAAGLCGIAGLFLSGLGALGSPMLFASGSLTPSGFVVVATTTLLTTVVGWLSRFELA